MVLTYLSVVKESYHICFTSHDEVLFRCEEDHGAFLNLAALRCYAMDTELIAEAEMSTHAHLNIFTDRPMQYASLLRMSYTRYFNHKYGRSGRFGEKNTYLLKVDGFNHQMVLENYILRNGLHHGAAATAFGYKYCSVREMFKEDIGMTVEVPGNLSRNDMAGCLPRHAEFPDHYIMDAKGIFLRSSFMEIRKAEQYYGSPRNFLFQMNRLTDESWSREQLSDRTGSPITLIDIERTDEKSITQMLKNESGRFFSRSRMQDIDVCRLIDSQLCKPYGASSPYTLSGTQKQRIAKQLYYDFRLPEAQIKRCLAMQ